MVNLTRIYTRTGDDGTTALGDFSRTPKTDPRLAAYADANEAQPRPGVPIPTRGPRADVRAGLLKGRTAGPAARAGGRSAGAAARRARTLEASR